MRVAYFVHDLSDPAVHRRARMLSAAGASVKIAGFRRAHQLPRPIPGAEVFELGVTHDARLAHRAAVTLMGMARAGRLAPVVEGAQVIIARMLESLALASAAQRACNPRAPLVYECLDIHRLMLADGLKGALMRRVERTLLDRSNLLMVSSPAFLDAYFRPRQAIGQGRAMPTLVVENKVLRLDDGRAEPAPPPRNPGPPWRIGWFGMIRCRRSLEILKGLCARRPGEVEVVIRGQPTPAVFPDFEAEVAAAPGLIWGGPYVSNELPELYRSIHFVWTPDWYEDGLNSNWLLPNRLYEGGLYGAVPIARAGVEVGHWLARHDLGVAFSDPSELDGFFAELTPQTWGDLEGQVRAADPSLFAADRGECEQLLHSLERLAA